MKKLLFAIPIIALLAGCGPTKVADESAAGCIAYDLEVIPDNNQLTVRWKSNCGELISGYNIYIQTQPVNTESTVEPYSEIKPHNLTPYPGDTNPDDDWVTYDALGLDNGVKYWVSVVVMYYDRSFSKPTREIMTACGPRGQIDLALRYSGINDGFSFSQGKYVEADELSNDLYYFHQHGSDYLDAPTRLDGFLRKTQLVKLEVKGSMSEVLTHAQERELVPNQDRVQVKKGDWLLVKTADNNFVLVQVTGFSGSGDNRRIQLFYAYSSIPNQIIM